MMKSRHRKARPIVYRRRDKLLIGKLCQVWEFSVLNVFIRTDLIVGWVDGVVKEVLTKGKKVDGKDVKASKAEPKIVLASNSSGKICVHKVDSCFYE